jgi:predicted lipase
VRCALPSYSPSFCDCTTSLYFEVGFLLIVFYIFMFRQLPCVSMLPKPPSLPTGHSLGGAVAKLCSLRLLQELGSRVGEGPPISCITFACPAVGNRELAAMVWLEILPL